MDFKTLYFLKIKCFNLILIHFVESSQGYKGKGHANLLVEMSEVYFYIVDMNFSFTNSITASRRFYRVPHILGSSSIDIFGLLFSSLSITFRRNHDRNSFDLAAMS